MENTNSKLILKNITPDQRKGVIAGTLGVTSLLGGAALFGFRTKNESSQENPDVAMVNTSDENTDVYLVDTSAKFYNENTDTIPFGDAFDAARENVGPGGFFNWNGTTYNTYYKEEWEAMNPSQQYSYISKIEESSDIQELKTKIIELEEQQSQLITENQSLNERVKELETVTPSNDVPPSEDNDGSDTQDPAITGGTETQTPYQNGASDTLDPNHNGETDLQEPEQNHNGDQKEPNQNGNEDSEDPTGNVGDDIIEPFSSKIEFVPEHNLKNGQVEIKQENGDVLEIKDVELITEFESDRDVPLIKVDETSEITEAMDIQEIEGMIDGDVTDAVDIEELEILEPIEPIEFEDTQDINSGDVPTSDFPEDLPNLF